MFLVIILWAFIGLQFLLFYFIYLFIRHRSNPRKGQKPRYWERLAQSRPWHGLEEAAPVAELSCACSSSLFHRTCTGRIETPQGCCLVVLSAAVNVSSLFFLEHGEVQRLVQDDVQTDPQNTWWDPFTLFTVAHHVVLLASKLFVCLFLSVCVCFCVCVCVCIHVMSHCVLSLHHCTQSLLRKTLIAPPTLSPRTMTLRWNREVHDGSLSSPSGVTNPPPFSIGSSWAALHVYILVRQKVL